MATTASPPSYTQSTTTTTTQQHHFSSSPPPPPPIAPSTPTNTHDTAPLPPSPSPSELSSSDAPPSYAPPTGYGPHNPLFRTEEQYLSALRTWAESKKYARPAGPQTLVGFYGGPTGEEYASRTPPLGIGRGGRARGDSGEVHRHLPPIQGHTSPERVERRWTVAGMDGEGDVMEEEEGGREECGTAQRRAQRRATGVDGAEDRRIECGERGRKRGRKVGVLGKTIGWFKGKRGK
ncbi:MAG: hypothetical protein M1831_004384 [Alyxoria varia]|nr:MAG: hypothetical protein M1831_004384 [Alyxoria varia]